MTHPDAVFGEDGRVKVIAVIALARKHVREGAMASSAQLCLSDAVRLHLDDGNEEAARARALKSLAYSVGMFHDDYKFAAGISSAPRCEHCAGAVGSGPCPASDPDEPLYCEAAAEQIGAQS